MDFDGFASPLADIRAACRTGSFEQAGGKLLRWRSGDLTAPPGIAINRYGFYSNTKVDEWAGH